MFKYTLDNKRYYTLNYYLKTKFNSKVFKVPLDAHFECPNKINGKGCIYCENNSKSIITDSKKNLKEQFNENIKILEKKWPNSLYILYFQAGTNTNAPIDKLKKIYEELLDMPKVVGISIATRPDCINDELIEYFKILNKKTFLTIELGLQSSNEKTLNLIKRGHNVKSFTETVNKLKKNNIFTVAHIINGLPFENDVDMLNTIKYLNSLDINGIKIHMLYISKNTELEKLYKQTKFKVLSKDEYINIVIKQLEILKDSIVVERITGDPIRETLIEPTWLLKKFCILNDIDKRMLKLDTWQGKSYQK